MLPVPCFACLPVLLDSLFACRHLKSVGCGGCPAQETHEEVDPTLLLDTNRRLEAVRWAPHDTNLVAAAATSDALVQLYDLQYTQVMSSPWWP